MNAPAPRLTAVIGLARALLETLGPADAIEVLIAEFGWDLTFQAAALVRGEGADIAFGLVWQQLLLEPLRQDLRPA